ncbi:MAG: ATP-binding protein [Roseovarius sp.]|jgi:hypothetical protein|nr:ATP-binding protein [Roseovarius sp.]
MDAIQKHKTVTSRDNRTVANWPLGDNALPKTLFPDEHLRTVIFDYLPINGRCSAATIRRGLKAHLKRTVPNEPRNGGDELTARDCRMAVLLGNLPAARDRASEITFFADEMYSSRGRSGVRGRQLQSASSFADLLWRGYSKVPEMAELYGWLNDACTEFELFGPGLFLTSETLANAFAERTCPVERDSYWLARSIVLFASLLPENERRALLEKAIELGCSPIADAYFPNSCLELAEIHPAKPEVEDTVEQKFRRPTLAPPQSVARRDRSASPAVVLKVEALEEAERAMRDRRRDAELALRVDPAAAIDGPEGVWQAVVEAVADARDGIAHFKELEAACIDQQEGILEGLTTRFGWNFNAASQKSGISAGAAGLALTELDSLRAALDELDPASAVVARWRTQLSDAPATEALWDLVHLAERDAKEEEARKVFQDEVAAYCSGTSPADVTAFLAGLDFCELAALLPVLSEPPWIVAGAVLLRAMLDKRGAEQLDTVMHILSASPQRRRALLRFADPTSSHFDAEIKVRRLIAVERMRDAVEFGPLAQINDPASGLSDPELVGPSVQKLIVLIVSNLDIMKNGTDVVHALRATQKQLDVRERLEAFIHAPATLSGNFRRLREKARELLFIPLLTDGRLDAHKARVLANTIASGQSLKEVIVAFERERPADRLETRHHEQLARYLRQGALILDDFLVQANGRSDTRRRAFFADLKNIRTKLRPTGEPGTVEWLEAEVASILDGEEQAGDQRTLVGDATPILERAWDSADQEWALSFLDLPEFHGDHPPTPVEVAASTLWWKSSGTPPSKLDIVCQLIDRHLFRAAFCVADDEKTKILVRDAAKPAVSALELRAEKMTEGPDPSRPHTPLDRRELDAALASLDLESAEEIIELWELGLSEGTGLQVTGALDTVAAERRNRLIEYHRRAGFTTPDEQMSVAELEASWADVLTEREKDRAHLIAVSSSLKKCAVVPADLTSRLTDFARASQDPHLWLPEAVSANFTTLVEEATPKLASWITNSPNFREEEQSALITLTSWYCDFILERSLSLHGLDDKDALQAGLDRIIEVAIVVLDGQRPSDCLAQLAASGEIEAPSKPMARAVSETPEVEPDASIPSGSPAERVPNSAVPTAERPLPEGLLSALQTQDWRAAIEVCESKAREANAGEADRLNQIARTVAPLMDQTALPSSEIADMFPSAAAWLFGHGDGADQIRESQRMELAFRLLTGAVAADSGQDMPRSPERGGSWAELLGKASPFRRMLSTGLPSRTGRVIEALLLGAFGLAVAERLWDAATNLSEPQNYRTPLLNLLSDKGAHEVIVRLAQRYEPTIAQSLNQLFELRSVAQNRPDLLPVAQSVAQHIGGNAKAAPFRAFVKGLPLAAQVVKPKLGVKIDGLAQLRPPREGASHLELPIIVTPEGLVPVKLFARLFQEDDLTFADGGRMKELSKNPIYFSMDFAVSICFGRSWFEANSAERDTVRIRIEAKTVTDELIQEDVVCSVRPLESVEVSGSRLDIETLLELYPGVANNPVVDKSFVGRIDELERLHQVLVSSKNPSPVLLTGMRRVGKTSLLYAFHKRCSLGSKTSSISIYLSLAERKVELASVDRTVASVFFRAISHCLVRPSLNSEDRNHALCALIRERFSGDWKAARQAIQDCYDEESLSSSLMALTQRLREWTGSNKRFIFLIDEAEALVVPYLAGGSKKLELEQFLQSLREVSQTTGSIGLLLSGSNHINVFAREYKNAFFGSSQAIELEGFGDVDTASLVVAPRGVSSFIQFEPSALDYAWELCAGMPQFLWQIGATTAFRVRSGSAARMDIRAAVAMLMGAERVKLPFKPYEILEPIDNMLSLEAPKERDLLWMLLYRVAQASSLAAQDAAIPFVIDQSLLAADDHNAWKRRLRALVDLRVLRMDSQSSVRFQVPLFAEGFRAPKNWQEFNIRQQQVGI